ncbi:CPA1 family monovalent cation:H+ antiporter [Haloferula luteola]|uniref:CPA1 family monovalent cation:H+ antiporter n=1 Tax=Haloferula luteola TaxID=595692 RepID=A0A840V2G1_9BACT|nr:sodium:proton antiporter [Haloferula luteola]MBB5351236.1 CPA1 family monovalent cation:H+ antiporter [Haloferula luteola]
MPSLLASSAPMSALVYLTLILALGVAAQWCAWRFKLPSILLLLAFGFGLGQFTGVRIDNFLAAGEGHGSPLLSAVGLFVAIILFEGGLTLKLSELRESGLPILRLCTLAVVISFALTTGFMSMVLGYDIRLSALIGAILTVTGPTVIAPLLRHVNPTRKMASIFKWEGIVVDPIGAILGVLIFLISRSSSADAAWSEVLWAVAKMALVGCIGGYILGKIVEQLLRRHWIPDYLQPVFLLAVVAVAFTLSNQVEKEAGLLTVTVLGVVLANQKSASVRHILEFKENLRTLIISSLFIVLSGRISLDELSGAFGKGMALLAFLIFIGRPLSVFGSLFSSKQTTLKERTFLAFLAPRGIVAAAVASVFALEFEMAARHGRFGELGPTIASQSQELTALIFLVIIGTVAVYGLAASPLARALGLASRNPTGILFAGADAWARLVAKALHDDGHRVMLLDTNYSNIAASKLMGLEAHRANILSEFAEEELDFNGIGSLVAGTPNDEVNSIAAQRFIHQFGRAHVWQLAPSDHSAHHRTATSSEIRVQNCFTGAPGHPRLQQLAHSGAVVKKSHLTEKFGFEDFQKTYADSSAIVLFLSDSAKGLRPAPREIEKLAAGTTLYVLVPDAPTPTPPSSSVEG